MLHHMLRAAAQRAFQTLDPYFKYVTMLLHGDGTNGAQNNTFLDSSTNNFTITRNGNTTQGTFTPYGSNWSNYFDGSGDYLSVANNAALQWSTGDFCVEAWIYPNSVSGSKAIVCKGTNDTGTFDLGLYGTKIELYTTALVFSSSASLSANTWTHIAVTRSGTTLRCFINGALDTTVTSSYNFNNAGTFYVGVYGSGSVNYFNGYMSNVRCVKGSAVYTSAFTPSTTPLTAITNTSLLTCQSNRFIDNSTNNFTITKNGDTSVQRFSPFSPTTAYSTSVIGGSGYFDGSGDYLTAPNSTAFDFSTADFTIACWVYPTTSGTTRKIATYSNGTALNSNYAFTYEIDTNNKAKFLTINGSTVYSTVSTPSVITNAWNYLVVTRSGATINIYVNGTGTSGSQSATINNPSSSTLTIGAERDATVLLNGYMAGLVLLKGVATAPGSSNPTSPATSNGNTSLLLNFTNAGILDNAMMNNLETVGNAQISTSVKKYGTGSMYFDGTGDGLKNINTPILYLTTGDWTVEGWIYTANPNASVASATIFCTGSPVQIYSQSNTIAMYVASDNAGTYFVNPASGPSSSVSANTWTHFACVKNGNNYTVYVNGTAGTTVTSATAPAIPTGITGIGYYAPSNSGFFTGYIDDLRITKGVARYTTTFTPPTAAFPNN